MIDIKLVRTEPEKIRELCQRRRCEVDVGRLVEVDKQLRETMTKLDAARQARKALKGPEAREKGAELKAEIAELERVASEQEEERNWLWVTLPNLLAPDTPDGKSDADNVQLTTWGEKPQFSFPVKPHEVLGADLGVLDLPRGAKVAGSGYYYWKGDGAKMVWALFRLAEEFLVKRGFTPMLTPVLARERTLFGTGYLPFFRDQIYKIEKEDLCLIGTSEQTMVGLHTDEILDPASLPYLYTAFTPCFRTEAGAYGQASRGAFRVHQFHKVEQIVFCRPEESEKWHEECLKNEVEFMQLLEVPYRIVRVCLGDLGAPGYKKYDVEAWFAGFNGYRETHSNTNLLDYQTRRLNIRCKDAAGTFYPHTISATMITDRAALAILENNQQADGSVLVPKALRPYMYGIEKIVKPA